ncbi:MAG: hypothetical protein M1826_003559 [Phylliscum demangeonii]|nr:MAG: hypothetical protein M1826_003559 [Phylliscum demangeonii]
MPIPHSSYYDRRARQTAALIRARKPYLVKNIFTGLGLFAFTIAIYVYTIKAISQDNFEDVIVPDEPSPPAQAPGMGTIAAVKALQESK